MHAFLVPIQNSLGYVVTKLKEWAFDCKKQNSSNDIDAEFHAEKSWRRGEIDVVR